MRLYSKTRMQVLVASLLSKSMWQGRFQAILVIGVRSSTPAIKFDSQRMTSSYFLLLDGTVVVS